MGKLDVRYTRPETSRKEIGAGVTESRLSVKVVVVFTPSTVTAAEVCTSLKREWTERLGTDSEDDVTTCPLLVISLPCDNGPRGATSAHSFDDLRQSRSLPIFFRLFSSCMLENSLRCLRVLHTTRSATVFD